MRVSRVTIENVRSYGRGFRTVDVDLDANGELPRWVVVAGRNGAGKSTFLQAVALAIAGPAAARSLVETFAGWIRQDASEATCAVQMKYAEGIDGLSGPGRSPTFDPWVGLRWTRQEEGPEPRLESYRPGGNWTPGRGPWNDNPQGWFLAGYGPFRRLSLAPAEVHRTMMTSGRPASLASLFREEASLSEAVHWLKQVYLQRLELNEEARALEELMLQLLNDGLLPEDATVTKVTSEGLWVETPTGPELPLPALSDGYRTVAALVLDVLKQLSESFGPLPSDTGPNNEVRVLAEGVVLIDEIDVHLHVSWQKRIGFWLKDHFPNVQFIVTTHSPFVCQAADVGGLVRLPAPNENRHAEVMSGARFASVVNGTADEAVLTDLFGLESPLSGRAIALRRELAEKERMVASGEGTADDFEQLNLLKALVPSTPTKDVVDALERIRADVEG